MLAGALSVPRRVACPGCSLGPGTLPLSILLGAHFGKWGAGLLAWVADTLTVQFTCAMRLPSVGPQLVANALPQHLPVGQGAGKCPQMCGERTAVDPGPKK